MAWVSAFLVVPLKPISKKGALKERQGATNPEVIGTVLDKSERVKADA